MTIFTVVWVILVLIVLGTKPEPEPEPDPAEWALPRDLNIVYGDVIQMQIDGAFWIGVHKPGDIATIGRIRNDKFGKVVYASASNLVDDKIFLARKVYPFTEGHDVRPWTKNHAVALISVLANRKLRVWWFCRPSQWMSYILYGKSTGVLDRWCPLRRDLSQGIVSAARIRDKSFYLENGVWWGDMRVYVQEHLPKV